MTGKTDGQEGVNTLSEEDLLKSLREIEGAKQEEEPKAKEDVVVTPELKKTIADIVKEQGSENLKKTIDVSDAFSELVTLIGNHVDTSLAALQKSVQAGAERDLTMIKIMAEFKKSIDVNTETLAKFGEQPGMPASSKAVKEGGAPEVLEKQVKEGGGKTTDPAALRKQIIAGLEGLAKSAAAGSPEQSRFIQATALFESTGKIGDGDLQAALAHTKAAAKAA